MEYDYTTLSEALQSWPSDNDPEYVAELPSIIKHGELNLLRDLGLGSLDANMTAVITSGSSELVKPDGILIAYEMWYSNDGSFVQLSLQQPAFVRQYNATADDGLSRYFCEETETTWQIAPPPNFTGTMNLRAIARPPGLDASTPTIKTWLSKNTGDLLLHYCLMAGEQFLKDDRRWGMVKTKVDLLLPEAKAEVAQLRRVLPEDQLYKRMVVRPENADATPQSQ